MIKIINGADCIFTYSLNNYSITLSRDSLILSLDTNGGLLRYQIKTDTREPFANSISRFISQQLDKTLEGKHIFTLSEYLTRSYIFIGEDDERRQFTAKKL